MDQLYFSIVCDGCLGDVGRVCGVARLAVRATLFRFQIRLIGVLVIARNSLISILVRTGRVPAIEDGFSQSQIETTWRLCGPSRTSRDVRFHIAACRRLACRSCTAMIACRISQSGTSTVGTNDQGTYCIASEPGPGKICKGEPSDDVMPKAMASTRSAVPNRFQAVIAPV